MRAFRVFHAPFGAVCAAGLAAAALFSAPTAGAAEPLPKPSGKVILTVSGGVSVTNAGGEAHFDMDMLRALGEHTVTTSTFFASGVHTFKGVLFSDLMDRVGAQGRTVTAKALDRYMVDIPLGDFRAYKVLLAYEKNGEVLRVRSKGPLRAVYPIDAHPELKNEVYESRSVWQIRYLTVR